MIYKTLKSLVDGLKTSYKCQDCQTWVNESDIDIVWAAWNTVNFDVICPKCGKHWIVKSQLMMMDLWWLTEIQHSIDNIKDKLKTESDLKITDSEIVDLDKNLKNEKINASDLFEKNE